MNIVIVESTSGLIAPVKIMIRTLLTVADEMSSDVNAFVFLEIEIITLSTKIGNNGKCH